MMRSQGRVVESYRQEQVNCPRCESVNTKFCYYNNYNQSQPRYFCKNCRRYWTRGGSLRSIPVGGGCRKNKPTNKPAVKPADCNSSSSLIPELPAITRSRLPCNYNYNYSLDNTDNGLSTVQESLIRPGSETLPRGKFSLGSNNLPTDAPVSCLVSSLSPPLGINAPPMGNNNQPTSWLLSLPCGNTPPPFGSNILHADTHVPCLSLPGGPETGLLRQPQSVMQQLQLIQEAEFLPELIKKGNQGGGEKGFLMESLSTHNSGQLNKNMNNASWPQFFPLSGLFN